MTYHMSKLVMALKSFVVFILKMIYNPIKEGFENIWQKEAHTTYKFCMSGVFSIFLVASVVGLYFLCGITSFKIYRMIDPIAFPKVDQSISTPLNADAKTLTDLQQAQVLIPALFNQLSRELNSPLGWTINDFGGTQFLSRRNARQNGVISATQKIARFVNDNVAVLGDASEQHKGFDDAANRLFVSAPSTWGFMTYSSESLYLEGLKKVDVYLEDLAKKTGQAHFNLRNDDLHNIFSYMAGNDILRKAQRGLVDKAEYLSTGEITRRIYEAIGTTLVVRDVVNRLVDLYPSKLQGAENNIAEAKKSMDLICSFDPIWVLNGSHDSVLSDHLSKLSRYYTELLARMDEIAKNIRY